MTLARLAVDIGGTFTDVALELPDAPEPLTLKLLTTPEAPEAAVMDGLARVVAEARIEPRDVGLIIHGTTLATNLLIERRGAKTALVVTEGHRDALEMAHENRFEQYDLSVNRPEPLVPRYLRLPVRERVDKDGVVLLPLEEREVEELVPALDRHDIESVAVGLIHGYANPDHEVRIAELLEAARPELSITLASRVCPEIREYERLSTACANAYVQPLMARYLRTLQRGLSERGFACPLLLMTSGGGMVDVDTAVASPIRLVESGPAGGAILASHLARTYGLEQLISFDMGGTTAKLCLIDGGEPLHARDFEVDRSYRFKKGSGLPVRIPVIEMVEIGAGGGSLVSVDQLGRVQVGPQSAGSSPGPAAYGAGGERATVTDADVVLGRIDPDGFAGGRLVLDEEAAARAVAGDLGGVMAEHRLDVTGAALAITEVVDENMANAARTHSVEHGKDVRARTLVAFGGAAPLHAARLADKLGLDRIVVPRGAGVGSALGFLLAPIAYEVVRSRYARLSSYDPEIARRVFSEMRAEADAVLAQAKGDDDSDSDTDNLVEKRQAYMRYVGQGHEVAVDLDAEAMSAADVLRDRFDATYRELYGRTIPGLDIEILSWTLSLSTRRVVPARESLFSSPGPAVEIAPCKTVLAYLGAGLRNRPEEGAKVETPCFRRSDLRVGSDDVSAVSGPALILEDQTTTVVPSGFVAHVTGRGDLVLERTAGSRVS